MPLNEADFSVLKETQVLCSQLEADLKHIGEFKKYLNEVNKRYKKLGELYETDWLRLTESKELNAEQRKQIEDMVPKGAYSIFWQDTVWNALSDLHMEYVGLLKSLAAKI